MKKIIFPNEPPYKVMAQSERYVVCSRKLNKRHDAGLIWHQVDTGSYNSFTGAYNDMRDMPVYTILDLKENIRSTDNMVFGIYGYSDVEDCKKAMSALESGELELSRRNMVEIGEHKII